MASIWDSIGNLITGGVDLANSRLEMNDAERAAGMADPWGPNRGRYADRLNAWMDDPANQPDISGSRNAVAMLTALMADPSKITSMPGYQFGLDRALEAVNRGASASGMLGSGNRLMALQDRGEGYARGWYNQTIQDLLGGVNANVAVDSLGLNARGQQFGELDRLAGVTAGSPVAAAEALLGGRRRQMAGLGEGIGGLVNGIGGIAGQIPWSNVVRAITGSGGGASDLLDMSAWGEPGMMLPIEDMGFLPDESLFSDFLAGDELNMLPFPDFSSPF